MEQEVIISENGIRNLNPQPGEPERLVDEFPGGPHEDGTTYLLTSLTPGLQGGGQVLNFAGSQTPASIAAAQWYTGPALATALAGILRKPSGELPRYYQVVIEVRFRDGIPVETRYLFHRELQVSH
jgi:hypothetical protein